MLQVLSLVLGVALQDNAALQTNEALHAQPLLAPTAELSTSGRAEVLVLVSDHGSGTTNFGDILNTHPCILDVGEPFGSGYVLWSTFATPAECEDKARHPAMFDADNGKLEHADNPKMTREINDVLTRQEWNKGADKVYYNIDSRSLYVNLTYNLAEYFVRIRDLVCAHVPASARAVCPAANCSIMLKMFPVYVDGDTVIDHTPSPGHASCQAAQNIKAMKAWKDALHSFELDPKVATLNFERKEVDRQFSNFHRFTPIGTEFDCSYPRPTPTFAVEAVKHTQLQLQAESCWVHPQKCISRPSPHYLPVISRISPGHLPNISRALDGGLMASGGCLSASDCLPHQVH